MIGFKNSISKLYNIVLKIANLHIKFFIIICFKKRNQESKTNNSL